MENPGEKTIGEQELSQDQLSKVMVESSQNTIVPETTQAVKGSVQAVVAPDVAELVEDVKLCLERRDENAIYPLVERIKQKGGEALKHLFNAIKDVEATYTKYWLVICLIRSTGDFDFIERILETVKVDKLSSRDFRDFSLPSGVVEILDNRPDEWSSLFSRGLICVRDFLYTDKIRDLSDSFLYEIAMHVEDVGDAPLVLKFISDSDTLCRLAADHGNSEIAELAKKYAEACKSDIEISALNNLEMDDERGNKFIFGLNPKTNRFFLAYAQRMMFPEHKDILARIHPNIPDVMVSGGFIHRAGEIVNFYGKSASLGFYSRRVLEKFSDAIGKHLSDAGEIGNTGSRVLFEADLEDVQKATEAVEASYAAFVSDLPRSVSASVNYFAATLTNGNMQRALEETIRASFTTSNFNGHYRNYLSIESLVPGKVESVLEFKEAPCYRIYDDMDSREVAKEFRSYPKYGAYCFAANLWEEDVEKAVITSKFNSVIDGKCLTYSQAFGELLNHPALPQPDPEQLAELDRMQSEMADIALKYCADPKAETTEVAFRGILEKTFRAERLLNPDVVRPKPDRLMANLAQIKKYRAISQQAYLRLISELSSVELVDLKQQIRGIVEQGDLIRRIAILSERLAQFSRLRFPDETAEGES